MSSIARKTKAKGQKHKKKKEIAIKTPKEDLLVLRRALRDENGKDRNVLSAFSNIAAYTKHDLDLQLTFHAGPLPRAILKSAKVLSRANLRSIYDSGGYGWDEDEKTEELKGQDARFILIWNKRPGNSEESSNKQPSRTGQDLCGFVNFRFTLQGEVVNAMEGRPALMLYEINFKEEVQRKGLGRYIMMLLELIAKKQQMCHINIPVVKGNTLASNFFQKTIKGFKVDATYGEDAVQMILSKSLLKPKPLSKKLSKSKVEPSAKAQTEVAKAPKLADSAGRHLDDIS